MAQDWGMAWTIRTGCSHGAIQISLAFYYACSGLSINQGGSHGSVLQKVGHKHHGYIRVLLKCPPQAARRPVMQEALPPVGRNEFGQHDSYKGIRLLIVHRVDIVEQRTDKGAVRRFDDDKLAVGRILVHLLPNLFGSLGIHGNVQNDRLARDIPRKRNRAERSIIDVVDLDKDNFVHP